MRGLIHVVHSLPEEVAHIAVINVVKSVFFTVIGVFLPIVVYSEYGFPTAVLYLFLAWGLFYTISVPIARKIVYELGIERTQIVALASLFLASILVYTYKNIFLIALFYGFSQALYWISKHLCFGLFGKRKEVVEELTVTDVLGMVASVLAPLGSAVVVYFLGFDALFVLASLGLLVTLAFLWKRYIGKKTPIMAKKGLKAPKKFYILFSLEGIVLGLNLVIFALLLYIYSEGVLNFGLFRTLGPLMSIGLALPLSFFVDRKHEFALSSMGYLLSAYLLLAGAFSLEYLPFIVVLLLFLSPLRDLPFVGFLYKEVKRYGGDLVINRAYLLGIFRSSILLALLIPVQALVLLTSVVYILYAFVYYFVAKPEE